MDGEVQTAGTIMSEWGKIPNYCTDFFRLPPRPTLPFGTHSMTRKSSVLASKSAGKDLLGGEPVGLDLMPLPFIRILNVASPFLRRSCRVVLRFGVPKSGVVDPSSGESFENPPWVLRRLDGRPEPFGNNDISPELFGGSGEETCGAGRFVLGLLE